jgi:NhaP-type Na+/H+ or K+/H+ antiporter
VKDASSRNHGRDWIDLLAFLAVLATCIVLAVFCRITVAGLPIACTALAGLYGAWRGRVGH